MLPPMPYGPLQWPYWDPRALYHQQFMRASSHFHMGLFPKPMLSPSALEEETFEEQKTRGDEVTPLTYISSSLTEEAVMPPPPSVADGFRQFQELMKHIVDVL